MSTQSTNPSQFAHIELTCGKGWIMPIKGISSFAAASRLPLFTLAPHHGKLRKHRTHLNEGLQHGFNLPIAAIHRNAPHNDGG